MKAGYLVVVISILFVPIWSYVVGAFRETTWVRVSTIDDVYTTQDRISVMRDVNSPVHCTVQCSTDTNCVLTSYTPEAKICELYSTDISLRDDLVTASLPNVFYRVIGHCSILDYTYLESVNTCIKFHSDVTNYSDARNTCQIEGGDLMIVNTPDKYDTVVARIHEQSNSRFWIGAFRDPDILTKIVWINGDLISGTVMDGYWAGGEPNNHETEQCVELQYTSSKKGFNDKECWDALRFLCEISPVT